MGNIKRVHMIGIGGIGMSALARHFLHEGKIVSGSDRAPSVITQALEAEGVLFFSSQTAGNVTPDIDLVVYTEAMSQDHEEMVASRALGIPMMNYFEALGEVANRYYLIAVAGTHGKTTTTSMLIDICEDAHLDPSAIVGSLRRRSGTNYRAGKRKYFIVEACEYKRDFLSLMPQVLVITNIEAEHLDYYRDIDDVVDAFRTLAHRVPGDGYVVCNTKDATMRRVLEGVKAHVVDYTDFLDLLAPMEVPGMHNRMNAAAAVAAAAQVGVSRERAQRAVSAYEGAWRRFEYKGALASGAPLYDDYGHHPSEIAATLAGAREKYPEKKLLLVYEPHMYSRTKALFGDFASVLAKADEIVLVPIYAAREENLSGVTSEQLAHAVGGHARAVQTFEEARSAVMSVATSDSWVVLTMGAGNIHTLAEILIS